MLNQALKNASMVFPCKESTYYPPDQVLSLAFRAAASNVSSRLSDCVVAVWCTGSNTTESDLPRGVDWGLQAVQSGLTQVVEFIQVVTCSMESSVLMYSPRLSLSHKCMRVI